MTLKIKRTTLKDSEYMIITANSPYIEWKNQFDLMSRIKFNLELSGLGFVVCLLGFIVLAIGLYREGSLFTDYENINLNGCAYLILCCFCIIIGYIIQFYEILRLNKLQIMYHLGILEIIDDIGKEELELLED